MSDSDQADVVELFATASDENIASAIRAVVLEERSITQEENTKLAGASVAPISHDELRLGMKRMLSSPKVFRSLMLKLAELEGTGIASKVATLVTLDVSENTLDAALRTRRRLQQIRDKHAQKNGGELDPEALEMYEATVEFIMKLVRESPQQLSTRLQRLLDGDDY